MINFLRNHVFKKDRVIVFKKKYPAHIKLNKKSKKKIYMIKRNRWHGMFSNLHYVILHQINSKKKGLKFAIDMENFPTIYNEEKKIQNTYNSWNYYFDNKIIKNLNKIYKENQILFSDSVNLDTTKINNNMYNAYVKTLKSIIINNEILRESFKFKKKFFKSYKILGVHMRGSDQKRAALHPFPPTILQMFDIIESLSKIKKFEKIFVVTEDLNYLKKFKNKFKDKLIYLNCYRSKKSIFDEYPRKNHRYLLGKEIIINMILLSNCNHLIHNNSNFSSMAKHFSNKKIGETLIFNGINSKNIFLANILWYLKSILPYKFGGLKNIIKHYF